MTDEPNSPGRKAPAVGYVYSNELNEFFGQQSFSLIVSTYQAQRLLLFSAGKERLHMLMRCFDRPTGMALNSASQLALYSKNKVWTFHPAGTVREVGGATVPHDLFLVPRRAHVTGDIAGHELAWHNGRILIVNTRFSCIATIDDPAWSFTPLWKPSFISACVPEDRCHLNGMAMDSSGPRYVSALAESDSREGWRSKRMDGILIEYSSREIICRGLCMPHSPRIYRDKLWILNSGAGELLTIDPKTGSKTTVLALPGYLRGLDFFGRFAFIGSSKIRDKDTFGGMPIETKVDELQCAVHVIDIENGRHVGLIQFTKGIEELFDLRILPGVRAPQLLSFEDEGIEGLYVFPSKN